MAMEKNSTKVLACLCISKYQDDKYGKGNRLHNYALKARVYRCTVCERTKN